MIRKLMLIALIALGIASTAQAATSSKSSTQKSGVASLNYIGPRLGFSVDPDQGVIGGHLSAGFAPDWTFNPSLEVGFGDHETVTALNFDAEYHFRIKDSNWAPYVGGGLGVNFVNTHYDQQPPNSDFNVSDTVTGLNIIVGTSIPTASGQHLFTELRFGAGDAAIPELKGMFGWNFRL